MRTSPAVPRLPLLPAHPSLLSIHLSTCSPAHLPTPAGQSSYAHHIDSEVGQHIVDQLSFHLHQFLMRLPPHPSSIPAALAAAGNSSSSSSGGSGGGSPGPSLQQLLDHISGQRLSSEVQVRTDLSPRRPADVPVLEFFGGPAAAASVAVPGSGEGEGMSSAVQALRLLAQEQREQGAAAAAAGNTEAQQRQQQVTQEEETPGMPLFELLAGAAGDSSPARPPFHTSQAAAVAAAWAAAVALSRCLFKS